VVAMASNRRRAHAWKNLPTSSHDVEKISS